MFVLMLYSPPGIELGTRGSVLRPLVPLEIIPRLEKGWRIREIQWQNAVADGSEQGHPSKEVYLAGFVLDPRK